MIGAAFMPAPVLLPSIRPRKTLIYDTLWYDANGNTAAGLIVLVGLSGAPVLTAGDFMVF